MKTEQTMKHCPDIMDHLRKGLNKGKVFSEIVECFGKDLKVFAKYKCGQGNDAEDVYQDAMLAAYRYIDSFKGEASLKNWLLKIVSNACLQRRRGRKNNPKTHLSFDSSNNSPLIKNIAAEEPSAEARAMVNERLDCLRKALEDLSDTDRQILLLHEGSGIPLIKIASEFNMTIPTIKSRLFRSRKAIRKHMDQKSLGL